MRGKEIDLIIDPDIRPIAQRHHRVPFHLPEKVEKSLSELEQQGIIEKVPDNAQTDWVSPIVVVPKADNNIRICVDMRAANTAIKHFRHPFPTVKDITLELNNAEVFSKLDMTQAYHQIPLSQDCRHITTFSTHCGLYKYCRLKYGTNASVELFQHQLQTTLEGIKGVRNIADDIIIFANDRKQHDKALAQCLDRLEQNGLTLNFRKCKFLKESLEFFGLIFSKDSTRSDPKKIEVFVNTSTPTSVSEVRSLLGMATYSSQFIPNFATITEPLRSLTRKGTHFSWTKGHENAYE